MNDLNLFIIDLDEKSIKIAGKDKLPDLPYSLYKTLHDGLEEQFGIKRKKISKKIQMKNLKIMTLKVMV